MGRRLAFRLWIMSMICWWLIGLPFSRLWWLVNQKQADWILFCYAWEVPAIGWTGVVLLPYLQWTRLRRSLDAGEPGAFQRLVWYPAHVAALILGTSSLGYLLGALQIRHFAQLPVLETFKIIVQGPALGAAFAVAGFLEAERAIRRAGLPQPLVRTTGIVSGSVIHSISGKVFFITIALTLGAAAPIVLYSSAVVQRQAEDNRELRLLEALDGLTTYHEFDEAMSTIGPHTYGMVVRGSNNQVVYGRDAGAVLYADGRHDFSPILSAPRGTFESRDREHKVVAFRRLTGVLPDGDDAILVAVSPIQDYGLDLIASGRTALIVSGIALLLAIALTTMFARSVLEPIERLRAAAARMASGDLGVDSVSITGGDEVSALARQFDLMAQRVRDDEDQLRLAYGRLQAAQTQLVQAEKLSAAGRVVSGVAHELNNPLSAILHFTEDLLEDKGRPSADQQALNAVRVQAGRARKIVRDLLSFVHSREHHVVPLDVREVLGPVELGVRPELERTGARMTIEADQDIPPVLADASGIEQVLTNLIINGAQAAGVGGVIRVRIRAGAEGCCISVEDNGPGIPPHVMPHIFEPFFTTKPYGEGTGLGLSVSLGIAGQHGGTLQAENRSPMEGPGARFTLSLPYGLSSNPAGNAAMAAASPPESAPAASNRGVLRSDGVPSGTRAVLLIDDEAPIRIALRRYFERTGWTVEEAADGEAGLAKLVAAPPEAYTLILTDLKMPRLSGAELHDRLAALRPDLFAQLIIMTGDVGSPEAVTLLARTDRPMIEKPFELAELGQLIDRLARP
jgi:signal transduction histidine kinase